jgi:hypothetical protein
MLTHATSLIIADWSDPPTSEGPVVRDDLVPQDLRADRFLAILIHRAHVPHFSDAICAPTCHSLGPVGV